VVGGAGSARALTAALHDHTTTQQHTAPACAHRFEDAFPGTPYDLVVDLIGGDYERRRWVGCTKCHACCVHAGHRGRLVLDRPAKAHTLPPLPSSACPAGSLKLLKPGAQGGHFAHVLNSGFVNQ
jgi:hypothetical protein